MTIFFLTTLFLGDVERNAHRLHVVAACLKLDDAPRHKDLDLALPRLPPAPSYPQPKVAAALSDLLGEGRFSQSVRLPHNYFIGMGLYMSVFCLTLYFFFWQKVRGLLRQLVWGSTGPGAVLAGCGCSLPGFRVPLSALASLFPYVSNGSHGTTHLTGFLWPAGETVQVTPRLVSGTRTRAQHSFAVAVAIIGRRSSNFQTKKLTEQCLKN